MNYSINPDLSVSKFTNIYTKYDIAQKYHKMKQLVLLSLKILLSKNCVSNIYFVWPNSDRYLFQQLITEEIKKTCCVKQILFFVENTISFSKILILLSIWIAGVNWKTVQLRKHLSSSRLVYCSKEIK